MTGQQLIDRLTDFVSEETSAKLTSELTEEQKESIAGNIENFVNEEFASDDEDEDDGA